MGRVSVVDLESGGQGALGKRVRVVTKESVVIAEQGVVDCVVVAVRDEQVLMLRDDLMAKTNTLVSPNPSDQLHSQAVESTRMPYIHTRVHHIFSNTALSTSLYLNHHGCIGNVCSPGERFIPAYQRICLIVVDGHRA